MPGQPKTPEERHEYGKSLRDKTPLESHAEWSPGSDRRDPVELVEEQNEGRVPWLVPVRRVRMAVSPFTFYRGSARIMATDLAKTPASGIETQICGDAHLSNFGIYASPERRLVFDLNDHAKRLNRLIELRNGNDFRQFFRKSSIFGDEDGLIVISATVGRNHFENVVTVEVFKDFTIRSVVSGELLNPETKRLFTDDFSPAIFCEMLVAEFDLGSPVNFQQTIFLSDHDWKSISIISG